MNRAHALLHNYEVKLFTSTVKGRCENRYMLVSDGVSTVATRAAGCLLQPEPGDTVLTVTSEDGASYILNVLVRGATSTESRISTPDGRMTLEAEDIGIEPRRELNISTPSLDMEATVAKGRFGTLEATGTSMESRFLKLTTVAKSMESVSEVLFQKTGRCYRKVQEFEEATIGRLRMVVDGLFSLSSKSARMKAEKRFKVDAEKIHLG